MSRLWLEWSDLLYGAGRRHWTISEDLPFTATSRHRHAVTYAAEDRPEIPSNGVFYDPELGGDPNNTSARSSIRRRRKKAKPE